MAENHFDRLSDDLLRLIFNRVVDVRSLCRCLSVSRRFSSLATQANSVSLRLPPPPRHHVIPPPPPLFPFSKRNNLFTSLVTKLITTPLHFLHRVIISPSPAHHGGPHFSPARLLKPFKDVVDLHVQLPDAPRGDDDHDHDACCCLLKWNAAFGRQFKSCVILGAKEIINNNADVINGGEEFDDNDDQLMYNEELQLRVVWTISCLIAASARHCLIKQLILDRPLVRRVEITDDKSQGRVVVEDDDVGEMRNYDDEKLEESRRAPAMRMKMWFVGRLGLLDSGRVVNGATLVLIKAVDEKGCTDADDDLLISGAFDGEEEKEIVREMAKKKKKMYTMKIDSF